MKLSTRSTYGMRALVELALAADRTPVSAALIAKRQDLSLAYLEQLLHQLKKHGVVRSVRGPRGGYVLAKLPQDITMAEIVGVLDGERGHSRNGNGRQHSSRRVSRAAGRLPITVRIGQAQRIADAVWRCVHERLTQALSAVTLKDLCEEVGGGSEAPLDHRYVFHI